MRQDAVQVFVFYQVCGYRVVDFFSEREGCVDLHSAAYQLPQSQQTGHFMYLLNPTPLPPRTQLHFSFFPPVLFTHSHLEPAQTGSVNQHACK